jgi:hypothetical protein
VRRGDDVAWLAARSAFGPRLVELFFDPNCAPVVRREDIPAILNGLPAFAAAAAPTDPLGVDHLIMTDCVRGAALARVGRLEPAREAFTAAFARLAAAPRSPQREQLHAQLLKQQLVVATAAGDRDGVLHWLRRILARSDTPDLVLEQMQANVELTRLLGAAAWDGLAAELRAARCSTRAPVEKLHRQRRRA